MFTEKNNFIIKQAYEKYHNEEHADFYDGEFSDRYKRRKKRDISRQTKFYYPIIKTTTRRVVSFVAVIAILIIPTTIYANIDNSFKTQLNNSFEKAPVPQQLGKSDIEVTLGEKKVKLIYDQTRYHTEEQPRHKYCDENFNEYILDKNGNIVSFTRSLSDENRLEDEFKSSGKRYLNEEEVKELARTEFKKIYPQYEKTAGISSCDYSDKNEEWHITFYNRYGKDDFMVGEVFNINLDNMGIVHHWGMAMLFEMEGFDESLLDGLSRDKLEKYAQEQLEAASKGMSEKYTLTDIFIEKVYGKFALNISMIDSIGKVYEVYYELK